ncbi:MAG: hypothetical protein JJU13_10340 [Balneolaceae bacterium]|nr:hypothetical protein [Balneolaceae bacterium]
MSEKDFYKGIHPEDVERFRVASENARKSIINFGNSLKPAADNVIKAAHTFKELSYRMMEAKYKEQHGDLPDVSPESIRWMVRKWYDEQQYEPDDCE